jgi:hypothetical protein
VSTLQADPDTRQDDLLAHQDGRQDPHQDAAARTLALAQTRAAEMATYSQQLLAPYVKRIEEQAEEIGALKAQLAAATPTTGTNGVAHVQAAAATASTPAPAPAPAEAVSAPVPVAAGAGAARPWWRRAWAWMTGDQAAPGAAAG